MLKSPYLGYILLISCYITCFITSLIIPNSNTSKVIGTKYNNSGSLTNNKNYNFGIIFKESILNSLNTSFMIGGFIILFSVLLTIIKNNIIFDIVFKNISLLLNFQNDGLKGLCLGIVEMTNGCSMISCTKTPIIIKIILISFLLEFGGLSIASQVYSFTCKLDISFSKYIKLKFIQGILCSIISTILLFILHSNLSIETFARISSTASLHYIIIIQIITLVIPLILYYFKKLFYSLS